MRIRNTTKEIERDAFTRQVLRDAISTVPDGYKADDVATHILRALRTNGLRITATPTK